MSEPPPDTQTPFGTVRWHGSPCEPPPDTQTPFGTVRWHGSPWVKMTALVLLPWDGGGTTIAKRGEDGVLYGGRDVTHGHLHDGIVRAWVEDAREKGLPVDDLRGASAGLHRPPRETNDRG